MSLFDVDTSNNNRQSPAPNKVDQISADARMAHGTHSISHKVDTDLGRRLVTKDSQIIANNGTNDLALFGFLPDGNVGLKTVDPSLNINVQDATDQQLNFNSLQDTFKIIRTGIIQVSSDGSTLNYGSLPHNLTFTPIVQGYLNNATIGSITTTGSIPLPLPTSVDFSLAGTVLFTSYLSIFADTTNIYALLYNGTGSPISTLTVTYYLLQETSVNGQ